MNARARCLPHRLGSHIAWLMLLVLGCASQARALDVPLLRGRVNDGAGLLSSSERAELEQWLAAYEGKTGHQFTLLTVPTLEGQPIEDFGIKVAEQWKLGSAKGDEGLILIVAANDRKSRIEVGHGLEGALPDAVNARVLREVLAPAFRTADYAGGVEAAFGVLMQQASGEAPPAKAEAPRERQRKRRSGSLWGVLSPLILPLLLFFAFSALGGRRGRSRGFFLGGPFIGGGGGGWSSGGGGGFSGGGGSFGGGGASGDW